MSERIRSLVFAVAMCTVCSLLLTAAATGLRERQEENLQLDRKKNLLRAAGLIAPGRAVDPETVRRRYAENIEQVRVDRAGRIVSFRPPGDDDLALYLYRAGNTVQGYIVPVDARGLWGKIHGYMALANDGATIAGFTVYKHNETPGLGGEIERAWFQENFVGKRIVAADGAFVSITIAKGALDSRVPEKERIHLVDGISGATLTGRFLTAGLHRTLKTYEPVSVRFRTDRMIRSRPKGAESGEAP